MATNSEVPKSHTGHNHTSLSEPLLLAHTELSQYALISRSTLLHEPLSPSFGPILYPLSSPIVPSPCLVTIKRLTRSSCEAQPIPVVTESGTADGTLADRARETARSSGPSDVTQRQYAATQPTQGLIPIEGPATGAAEHVNTAVQLGDGAAVGGRTPKPEGENQRPGRGGYTLAHVVHWDAKTLKAIEVRATSVSLSTVSLMIDKGTNENHHGKTVEPQPLLVATRPWRSSRCYR